MGKLLLIQFDNAKVLHISVGGRDRTDGRRPLNEADSTILGPTPFLLNLKEEGLQGIYVSARFGQRSFLGIRVPLQLRSAGWFLQPRPGFSHLKRLNEIEVLADACLNGINIVLESAPIHDNDFLLGESS